MSRTLRVDWDWTLERLSLERSIVIRHVRVTEQVADLLTKGAVTTLHWESAMQLFANHPQPKLNVDRSSSASSCSAISRQPLHAISAVCNTPSRLRKWVLERSWRIPQRELKITLQQETESSRRGENPMPRTSWYSARDDDYSATAESASDKCHQQISTPSRHRRNRRSLRNGRRRAPARQLAVSRL